MAILSKKKLTKYSKKTLIQDKNKAIQNNFDAELTHSKIKIYKLINIYTPNGNPVDTEKYSYKIILVR